MPERGTKGMLSGGFLSFISYQWQFSYVRVITLVTFNLECINLTKLMSSLFITSFDITLMTFHLECINSTKQMSSLFR